MNECVTGMGGVGWCVQVSLKDGGRGERVRTIGKGDRERTREKATETVIIL